MVQVARRVVLRGGVAVALASLAMGPATAALASADIGTILLFGFNYAPRGWALCNGQLLPIAQNQALFSLLGTMYGGNGQTTFGLPDLRGRVPMGFGQRPGLSNYAIGETGGSETVTLTQAQLPAHTHTVNAAADATSKAPTGNLPATTGGGPPTGLRSPAPWRQRWCSPPAATCRTRTGSRTSWGTGASPSRASTPRRTEPLVERGVHAPPEGGACTPRCYSSPRMKASTFARAVSSSYCSGGLFMK